MHEIKIGSESYVGKSNSTVTEAKRNVAYETLMRTRYAFSVIPEELKMFKPKSNFCFDWIVVLIQNELDISILVSYSYRKLQFRITKLLIYTVIQFW